jgi:FkbM family methyltransferase
LGKEKPEIRFLLDHIKPGDTAFDIGCHKGAYLYWMQKQTGRQGHVHAFEPQPALAAYLQTVQSAFAWDHVTVNPVGLGHERGEFDLMVPGQPGATSPGSTFSATQIKEFAGYHTHRVQVTTLDRYCAEHAIDHVDFIKCDVEGFEFEVFSGGTELLRTCKPVLLFECEKRMLGERNPEELISQLKELGYKGWFFQHNQLFPVEEFDSSIHQKMTTGPYWKDKAYVNNFAFVAR